MARYSGIQGVVTVRALTSPSGCVVYAEIDTEQRPMPAIFQFNVRFKFTN